MKNAQFAKPNTSAKFHSNQKWSIFYHRSFGAILLKSITGNLDNNDLDLIKQAIDSSNQKTNTLIQNNDQQIKN